jgi:hypothetical protein
LNTEMSSQPDSSGLLAESTLFESAARLIIQRMTDDFDRIELFYNEVGPVGVAQLVAFHEDGSEKSLRKYSDVTAAMKELRAAMYREGAGAWFGAHITVTAERRVDATYAYDVEPEIDFEIDSEAYLADFERYPRDEAKTPDWLKTKLDAARG